VFGYTGWPMLLERIGFVTAAGLLLLALAFIVIGRRRFGAAHIVRAALGLLGLLLTVLMLADLVPRHRAPEIADLLKSQQLGPALEILVNQMDEVALFAAVLFSISIIILAWPPRRQGYDLYQPPAEGA
jgi:hypothetical protein